jgi:hypothetical protein
LFKRYIILISVIIFILGIFSSFTLADSSTITELQVKTDKAEPIVTASSQDVINPELVGRAKEAGINTTGLTSLDVKIKLQEAWNVEFREKAKVYGIDTTNLSDDQVREQVLTIENAEAIAKAKKAGVKTDGLTYSQVMAGIEEWDRENARKNFGINTDGMTYSQVIQAVQERAGKMSNTKDGIVNNQKNNNNDNTQLMNDLIVSAKALGINYEGLSYEELYEKVITAKKATLNNK